MYGLHPLSGTRCSNKWLQAAKAKRQRQWLFLSWANVDVWQRGPTVNVQQLMVIYTKHCVSFYYVPKSGYGIPLWRTSTTSLGTRFCWRLWNPAMSQEGILKRLSRLLARLHFEAFSTLKPRASGRTIRWAFSHWFLVKIAENDFLFGVFLQLSPRIIQTPFQNLWSCYTGATNRKLSTEQREERNPFTSIWPTNSWNTKIYSSIIRTVPDVFLPTQHDNTYLVLHGEPVIGSGPVDKWLSVGVSLQGT